MEKRTGAGRVWGSGRGVFVLYALFAGVLALYHAPWRDEALHWLITRDLSLAGIFAQMGYEGTPALWHLLLFPFAKAGLPYFSMTALNLAVMLCAVFVFLKYSPFSRLEKTLAVFGYYFIFEYAVIARSYALTVLLLFSAAALYSRRFERGWLYAFTVFLLANTNAHGAALSVVLMAAYAAETLRRPAKNFKPALLMAAGIALAVWQLLPPEDIAPISRQWYFVFSGERLGYVLDSVVAAFLPLPAPSAHFWNTLLVYTPGGWAGWLALPLFALCAALLRRSGAPLLIFLGSCAGLFSIFYFKYGGFIRHYGLVWIMFLFCLWISRGEKQDLPPFWKRAAFIFLLAMQVMAGVIAAALSLSLEFSQGRSTAQFLREKVLSADTLVAAYPCFTAQSVIPYLPKPQSKLYFPEYGEFRSFLLSNRRYQENCNLPLAEVVRRVEAAQKEGGYKNAYLLLNIKASSPEFLRGAQLVAEFGPAVVEDESFYVYYLGSQP